MSLTLTISIALLASIAVPFLYYSVIINAYGQKNQPDGFAFPHIFDFWRTLAYAAICSLLKMIVMKTTQPFFRTIAKVKTEKELQEKYSRKASEYLF